MKGNTLLIGGTSHLGKTTLAKQLAGTLQAELISTDQLARHPGRPWKASIDLIPDHVVRHYEELGVDELIKDVSTHYLNQWPAIKTLIEISQASTLIIEGSAIGPSWVAEHLTERIKGIWLVATPGLIQERIYHNSQYAQRSRREQFLIDKFCQRSIRFNELVMAEVKQYSLPYLEVEPQTPRATLPHYCLTKIGWTSGA